MNTKTIGDISEIKVIAKLVESEYPVLIPFGDNQRYDLVYEECPGNFLRAQVKTGRLKDGAITFRNFSVTSAGKQDYKGQIEIFAVYCPETDGVYLVPINDCGTSSTNLRVDLPKNNHSKIKWAKDYQI